MPLRLPGAASLRRSRIGSVDTGFAADATENADESKSGSSSLAVTSIRLPRGTALQTEKPVLINPVPPDYRPPNSYAHQVTDIDLHHGWKGIARRLRLNPRWLIAFNFKTTNPDEVNWYLRRNVGCDLCTDDRMNWMFSSSADPGIIYLPIRKSRFVDISIGGMTVTKDLDVASTGFFY